MATAKFICLTCGLGEPKRAKTRKCPACGGDGRSVEGDDWERENGDCNTCDGKGRVPNDGPRRKLFPKPAAEWLKANWRRLVPTLAKDWDHKLAAEDRADRSGGAGCWWPRWNTRQRVTTLVPFLLPMGECDEVILPAGAAYRLYSPVVRLIFDRGFAEYASWQAPRLGPAIAARLAQDQPLCRQFGLGSIPWEVTMGVPRPQPEPTTA